MFLIICLVITALFIGMIVRTHKKYKEAECIRQEEEQRYIGQRNADRSRREMGQSVGPGGTYTTVSPDRVVIRKKFRAAVKESSVPLVAQLSESQAVRYEEERRRRQDSDNFLTNTVLTTTLMDSLTEHSTPQTTEPDTFSGHGGAFGGGGASGSWDTPDTSTTVDTSPSFDSGSSGD